MAKLNFINTYMNRGKWGGFYTFVKSNLAKDHLIRFVHALRTIWAEFRRDSLVPLY